MTIQKVTAITNPDDLLSVDTKTLAGIIDDLFMVSINQNYSAEERRQARLQATMLRGHLITLVSQKITGDAEIVDALNTAVKSANAKLKTAIAELDAMADALEAVAALAGSISDFIGMIDLL